MSSQTQISIAHSPDSDDRFMFFAIKTGIVSSSNFIFKFFEHDTAELNRLAVCRTYDVTALSVAALAETWRDYLVLPHGASVGRAYGPVVVAKKACTIAELNSLRIAVPGETTTARAILKLLAPLSSVIPVPITPYEEVFQALECNMVDAAVLIHEGQLLYKDRNLHLVTDLGEWWRNETSLPLPLGVNVIKKALGSRNIEMVSTIIRSSIDHAINHIDEILPDFVNHLSECGAPPAEPELVKRYLSMYANSDTLNLDSECRTAIEKILKGLNPEAVVDYAP